MMSHLCAPAHNGSDAADATLQRRFVPKDYIPEKFF